MEVSWNLAKQSQSEISKPKVTIFISSTFVTNLTILDIISSTAMRQVRHNHTTSQSRMGIQNTKYTLLISHYSISIMCAAMCSQTTRSESKASTDNTPGRGRRLMEVGDGQPAGACSTSTVHCPRPAGASTGTRRRRI
jgi:hypothetical protein